MVFKRIQRQFWKFNGCQWFGRFCKNANKNGNLLNLINKNLFLVNDSPSNIKNHDRKSPFPGMNPYLEGDLWPDVHHGLASVFSELLAPMIAPKYVARIDSYTVEDDTDSPEIGITYPIFEIRKKGKRPAPDLSAPTPPDLVIPSHIKVKVPFIQIKVAKTNQTVTHIEILSPVNKNSAGWQSYHEKRNACTQQVSIYWK